MGGYLKNDESGTAKQTMNFDFDFGSKNLMFLETV